MKEKQEAKQSNKIIKENLNAVAPVLIEKVLKIKALPIEKLKDKLQPPKNEKPMKF